MTIHFWTQYSDGTMAGAQVTPKRWINNSKMQQNPCSVLMFIGTCSKKTNSMFKVTKYFIFNF